jgi:D-3-phosphoglycerate dehydrogenase
MTDKHVVSATDFAMPAFDAVMAKHPEIKVDVVSPKSTIEAVKDVLAPAQVYRIGSGRNGMEPQFFATEEFLRHAPQLLMVSTTGVGADTADIDACTAAGVLVANQGGSNADAVAEHTFAMMIALSKKIIQGHHAMKKGPARGMAFLGREIHGKTLGIIGIGAVGTQIARIANAAFRMKVLACDPYLDAETIRKRGAEKVELPELLRRSDFVSLNTPLNPETRGMIDAEVYARMQPHAYFITTARGGIHDEMALGEALRAGKLAGAGLDVWEPEPPNRESGLLDMDNVIMSPHNAGLTDETMIRMAEWGAEQIIAALDGKKPPRIMNPAAYPRYRDRFAEIFGFRPPEV